MCGDPCAMTSDLVFFSLHSPALSFILALPSAQHSKSFTNLPEVSFDHHLVASSSNALVRHRKLIRNVWRMRTACCHFFHMFRPGVFISFVLGRFRCDASADSAPTSRITATVHFTCNSCSSFRAKIKSFTFFFFLLFSQFFSSSSSSYLIHVLSVAIHFSCYNFAKRSLSNRK